MGVVKNVSIQLFILLSVFSISSYGQLKTIKNEATLSFEQLKTFVNDQSIQTIDQLVPLLPTQMLQNSLLVYDSHALNLQLVKPETPRIIFFNQDASLILAITQNPGDQNILNGQDKLEIISFSPSAGLFEAHDVAFDGKPNPFDRAPAANPPLCLSCHGQNPRPLFQDYNTWPGFYGSFSQEGVSAVGTKEHEMLKNFLGNRMNLSRYKDLDLYRVTEGIKGISFRSSGFGFLYEDSKFSPGLMFGVMLEFRMYERLSKKIEKIPAAQKYKHLLAHLGRADECRGSKELHRFEIRDSYKAWMALQPQVNIDKADQITQLYEKQVIADHQAKEKQFTPYNRPDKSLDPRGMMNLPYETMVLGSPSWVRVDKLAFTNQIVMMESIGRVLGLKNEDVSTAFNAPSQGVFHIRKLGLYEDEQIFKGLYEAMVKTKSSLVTETQAMNCGELAIQAKAELAELPVAEPLGQSIFY